MLAIAVPLAIVGLMNAPCRRAGSHTVRRLVLAPVLATHRETSMVAPALVFTWLACCSEIPVSFPGWLRRPGRPGRVKMVEDWGVVR
jgi:hypothetical protein